MLTYKCQASLKFAFFRSSMCPRWCIQAVDSLRSCCIYINLHATDVHTAYCPCFSCLRLSEFVGCSAGPATDSGLRELELRLLDELEVRLVLELRLLLRVALLNDDCRVIVCT